MTILSGTPVDILLIEDNPGDVRLMREALKDYRVQNKLWVVSDGLKAMAFLHKEGEFCEAPRPDLILLDLNLPRKDGRWVLQEIKNNESLRKIPVVILTTSSAEADILKAYELHANCYITKPLDLEQFINVVMSIEGFWLTIVKLPPKEEA
ncbi:MAG TPA: response regulator [Anaerolineaceae bacterium]|nr:response regulator [Anaerolineaceae bacterium]